MSTNGRAYEEESFGRRIDYLELDRRRLVRGPEALVVVTSGGQAGSAYADGSVLLTVPDGRLMVAVDIQFVPADPGLAWPSGLQGSWASVKACTDVGGGFKPVETLVPQGRMCADNLWGFTYSPTEEVEALQVDFRAVHPGVLGRFVVRGRWQALRPIGEQDWRPIREACGLQFARGRVM